MNSAAVVWAADDGYDTQVDYFALLDTKGIKGTLFLSPDWLDRVGTSATFGDAYMTTAQAQAIANAGHEIGTHGKSHEPLATYYTDNGPAALDALMSASISAIESTLGVKVRTGSFPGGNASTEARAVLARSHEYVRSSKGLVSRHGVDPFDVPGIDILALTEAQVKAHIDSAVAARTVVVLFEHGSIDATELTKVSNAIDYATSLGVEQTTFYDAMQARCAWKQKRVMVDQEGNLSVPKLVANSIQLQRSDNLGDYFELGIDETTNKPYFLTPSGARFDLTDDGTNGVWVKV